MTDPGSPPPSAAEVERLVTALRAFRHSRSAPSGDTADLCDAAADTVSRLVQAKEQSTGPGSPSARLDYLLDALATRFPDAAPPLAAEGPEPQYLAALDALVRAKEEAEEQFRGWLAKNMPDLWRDSGSQHAPSHLMIVALDMLLRANAELRAALATTETSATDLAQMAVATGAARKEAEAKLATAERERAALAEAIDCACNALTDSIQASGNDARTNMHWVAKLRKYIQPARPDA